MKKKRILTAVLAALMALSMISLTACKEDETVYDAGEYGEIKAGSENEVIPDAGYCFIGWSEPVKEGHKTTYKAQYEHAEYYLSEEKDVYICPPNTYDGVPDVKRKIMNMQTLEVTKDEEVPSKYMEITSNSDSRCYIDVYLDGMSIDRYTQEFDTNVTLTVDDLQYNMKTEFKMHFVRNRIVAESIEIKRNSNTLGINKRDYITATTLPEDTSFPACGYTVLEVIRNGQPIPQSEISSIVYFDEYNYIYTTNEAQAGDIIKVQIYNIRDPQVKSNILALTVY